MQNKAWDGILTPPISGRLNKPRSFGWTMVIDKGIGLAETEDLLRLAADYIDLIKLTFGTSTLYPRDMLRKKTDLIRARGIGIMPGGTLGEIALWQGQWHAFLERAGELGFDTLEISDGTIPFSLAARHAAIVSARDAGFIVISEVGKKHPDDQQPIEAQVEQALLDLEAGAFMIIIEGRESGKGAGIYDIQGEIHQERLDYLSSHLPLPKVIWEAPQKSQQEQLILAFGPNVNLGNIPPGEVLALEALRLGLRGDTLRINYKSRVASQ